jgi:hypothetical protein
MNPNLKDLARETKNPDLSENVAENLLVYTCSDKVFSFDTVTMKNRQIAAGENDIAGICMHKGSLYHLEHRQGESILRETMTGREAKHLYRFVSHLTEHNGILYDAGNGGIWHTFTDLQEIDHNFVWGICSHKGSLHCCGQDVGIKYIGQTGETWKHDVYTLCSHDGKMYVSPHGDSQEWDGGIYNLSEQRMETKRDIWVHPISSMCSHMRDLYYLLIDEKVTQKNGVSKIKIILRRLKDDFEYELEGGAAVRGLCSVPKALIEK